VTQAETHQAINAVWRIEQARLVASLARMVRDISLAEELAQDALVAALEHWPESGIPDNPGAWLMATAKRRAIDRIRHRKLADEKHAEIGYISDLDQDSIVDELEARLDDDIGDDLLKLVFTACHPILSAEAARGVDAAVDRRSLDRARSPAPSSSNEPTVAQRIVRAKRTLADAHVTYEVPRGDERAKRLGSVLEVIYLIFNEGYSATAGEDWIRPPSAPRAHPPGPHPRWPRPERAGRASASLALMEIQASRFQRARRSQRLEPDTVDGSEPGALGSPADSSRGLAALTARGGARDHAAPIRCRPRLPPATHAPAPLNKPTGIASQASTPS
jgi:predicted RNA polymerase sigma factor